MNHRFSHTSDKVLNRQAPSRIMISQEELHRIYKKAVEQQMYPMGNEYKDDNGLYADWAPFDFILSVIKLPAGVSMMRVLKEFWAENWKYLHRVIKSYEAVSQDYIKAMDEMQLVVENHAEQSFELKVCQEWIGKDDKFAAFREEKMKIHLAAMEQIAKEEKERQEKEHEARSKRK